MRFFEGWQSVGLLAALLGILAFPAPAWTDSSAGETQPRQGMAETGEESWFQRELRKFRTYPRLEMAHRLMSRNQFEAARLELERYLEISPHDLEVRSLYLVLLHRLEHYPEVVEQASIILARQPASPTALVYRGMAGEKLGKDAEAIRDFQSALDLPGLEEPERVLLLETLVEHSLRQQQYAAALDKLRQLTAFRQDFRVFYRQGLALEKLGEMPQAEVAYRQSLSAASDNAERAAAARALAEVARKREDWAAARQMLQVALASEPQDRQTLLGLVQLSYADRDYAQALRWQLQAMALEATAEDQKFLVNLLILLQNREEAARELEALLPRLTNPQEQEQAGLQLGNLYLEQGNLAKATSAFRRAAEVRGSADAQLALARVLAMQGREADAVEPLKRAVHLRPTAEKHLELGMLLARTGNRKEAVEQLERAVVLGLTPPAAGQAYEQLGHLYLGLGHYRKSRNALLAARQAHRDSPAIAFALGDNSILLGEYDRAIAEFEAGLARQ